MEFHKESLGIPRESLGQQRTKQNHKKEAASENPNLWELVENI